MVYSYTRLIYVCICDNCKNNVKLKPIVTKSTTRHKPSVLSAGVTAKMVKLNVIFVDGAMYSIKALLNKIRRRKRFSTLLE